MGKGCKNSRFLQGEYLNFQHVHVLEDRHFAEADAAKYHNAQLLFKFNKVVRI